MYTFVAATLIESAKLNQNFTDLTTGDGDTTANSLKTFRSEALFDFVLSGGVWSADSAGVNKNASMTALVIVINGRRISISAVTARVFTASKDTYVDVLDNADGTGTLVYTEVTNNNASPALAANSNRIAIIVTGATTIAAAASINQGQQDRVLPIASSIPYAVTDSLGNLICGRDPNRKILGYRQIAVEVTTNSAAYVDITGLNLTYFHPVNRKAKISLISPLTFVSAAATTGFNILDVTGGTTLVDSNQNFGNSLAQPLYIQTPLQTFAAGARNVKAQFKTASGIVHSGIAQLLVELE